MKYFKNTCKGICFHVLFIWHLAFFLKPFSFFLKTPNELQLQRQLLYHYYHIINNVNVWHCSGSPRVKLLYDKKHVLQGIAPSTFHTITLKIPTCSALFMQLGSKGITGNMYSNGYNKDDIARIVIVSAL